MVIPAANITRPKIVVNSDMQLRKRKLNGFQSKPQELPNSEKFENITRPQIALNCDTLAKKQKLNRGSQTKPKDKDIVNNQVSKNIFSMCIFLSLYYYVSM